MSKQEFIGKIPTGKCKVCEINCWAHTNNEPAIWPCGVDGCPYPGHAMTRFERSSMGSSLSMITYNG